MQNLVHVDFVRNDVTRVVLREFALHGDDAVLGNQNNEDLGDAGWF